MDPILGDQRDPFVRVENAMCLGELLATDRYQKRQQSSAELLFRHIKTNRL